MTNDIIKTKCPNCQNALAFHRPKQSPGVIITCPKCGKQIKIKIRDREIKMGGQQKQSAIAKLIVLEGNGQGKRAYALRVGSNTIGRHDSDTVQDIAITGDMTISRRSVDLFVEKKEGVYSYTLKVLNAKNPVYVNNTLLHSGIAFTIYPGDTLLLGKTKMILGL